MAELLFNDYFIEELIYKRNPQFKDSQKPHLGTKFSGIINIKQGTRAYVHLKATIGSDTEINSPFLIRVAICGQFSYQKLQEEQSLDFEEYLTTNAIAILFPYLRSIISDLSSKSNEFPTLVLPVINIVQMMKDTQSITIHRLDN